ncbi:hypothetical protein [Francisella halioticida]|uniref:hypothetical protein n=1 Tax=Francisella halioticida TaxID=549298 RepID=UPI0012F72AEE|nr:hypothetical protein [Francisella halioticida]
MELKKVAISALTCSLMGIGSFGVANAADGSLTPNGKWVGGYYVDWSYWRKPVGVKKKYGFRREA